MSGTAAEKRGHAARVRTCAGCGMKQDKGAMLRIVRTPAGEILPDPGETRDGRGAYLCRRRTCLGRAQKRRSLERSLKAAVPAEVFEKLYEVIESDGDQ